MRAPLWSIVIAMVLNGLIAPTDHGALSLVRSAHAQAGTQETLHRGQSAGGRLTPTAPVNRWSLEPEAGKYVEVEIVQDSVDVVVRLVDPSGQVRDAIDHFRGTGGSETVRWITGSTGLWTLAVAPASPAQGTYRIRWHTQRAPTEADRRMVLSDSLTRRGVTLAEEDSTTAAEALLSHALELRQQLLGPDHPEIAHSLTELGHVLRLQARYSEAESFYARALQILERNFGPNHPNVALGLSNLALARWNQGRNAEAEPLYRRAINITEHSLGPEHIDLAAMLHNLSLVYDDQGQYAQAELTERRALSIAEKILGPEHPNVGLLINNLGNIYKDQGRNAEAEERYRRALAIWEKAYGAEHRRVAGARSNLANLLREQNRYSEADSLYHQALAVQEKVLGPDHPEVAATLNNLAVLYDDQDRYADAEPLYRRSLAIREAALGPEHPDIAWTLSNLGKSLWYQNKLAAARPVFDRAIAMFNKYGSILPTERILTYSFRAQVRRRGGDNAGALADLAEAIRLAERLRPEVGGDDETRADFFSRYTEDFDRMVAWQIEAGRVDRAFEYAERGRARALLDAKPSPPIFARDLRPRRTGPGGVSPSSSSVSCSCSREGTSTKENETSGNRSLRTLCVWRTVIFETRTTGSRTQARCGIR